MGQPSGGGRRSAKERALRAVKMSAAAVDRVRPPEPGVVVLLYHRVGGASGLEIDLPTDLFSQQVEALAEAGNVVSLDVAVDRLASGSVTGTDSVVVTFDDGTADFASEVVPILERFRVPATLYVATDFIERSRSFPHDGTPLSWSALAAAQSTGLVTVGSHTHTHALLDRASPAVVADELDRSMALIEDRLGTTPAHFAYPKALGATGAAEAEVRRRFRSAALGGGKANRYRHTDMYRLQRTSIQVTDGMRWFRCKAAGGMALEGTLRRMINRRYAGAAT